MPNTPSSRYQTLVANGQLTHDHVQEHAIGLLDHLSANIVKSTHRKSGFFSWLSKTPALPRGLYMWGGVGRGKTLLMDVFYNNTPIQAKKRVHFHEFMLDTHAAIAEWRALDDMSRRSRSNYVRNAGDDPIAPIARAIAQQARLLCFDEFQVTDIADAMILGRLFDHLYENGIIIVSTSNRHPDNLYQDGLNRGLFLPFIEQLKERLDILHLEAAKDYRLERLKGKQVYYSPLGPDTRKHMNGAWTDLIAGGTEQAETISVGARTLSIARTARGAARFTFEELCARPLGAADYLAIARRFSTVVIDDVPVMTPEYRNEAKRFVTLIDALYEMNVKLVISADAAPAGLYNVGDGSFEFERTTSRLIEMQSTDYLSAPHCDTLNK